MNKEKSIAEDLTAFADPFTDTKQKNFQDHVRVEFIRNGRNVVYEISKNSGTIYARHQERSYSNLRSLLASEEFANISRFTDTQQRAFERKRNDVTVGSSLQPIPSSIKLNDQLISAQELADQLTHTLDKTQLILMDGPAGVGKTYQVEQIAQIQAKKFKSGISAPPVLVISSRGRRLSNFRDVLAATTQDMGASFTANHVPILVRHSLLVAAIDGFDELVDADGYEDAWSALKEFIDEIGQGGIILLAARDTFVEEQELLQRINRADKSVSLQMGHIQPVRPQQAKEWLAKAPHWKPSDIESEITSDVLSEGNYTLRPFFLRIIGSAGGWANVAQSGLRTYLINSLIVRESRLMAQQLGGTTAELIAPSLVSLFQEIALEMATRETDSVEVDHLAFLTQYCFSDVLEDKAVRKLMHKAGSFSLLEPSWTKDRRKFPHSEIQSYFFGAGLIKSLVSRTIPVVLRRAALSGEHLEVFAEVFANDEANAKKAAAYLSSVLDTEITADQLTANGGAILILAFSLGLLERLDYITAFDAVFAGDAPKGEFVESSVSRLTVVGANLSKVIFKDVRVDTMVVDESTIFGSTVPAVQTLEIRFDSKIEVERDPEKISAFFKAHTAPERQNFADHQAVILLERIARRAIRYFYLREGGDDDEGAFLLKDPDWPLVRSVLEKHRRIEVKRDKPMHGRPKPLLRIVKPRDLLNYNDPNTIKILEEITSAEAIPS